MVIKRLDQSVCLLPVCPVEQLHLIGQALSLVDSLLGGGGTSSLMMEKCVGTESEKSGPYTLDNKENVQQRLTPQGLL